MNPDHRAWLQTLSKGDVVQIRNGNVMLEPAKLSDATPCYLRIGKLKFHRGTGWLINRQQRCRLKLLLVRNAKEFV